MVWAATLRLPMAWSVAPWLLMTLARPVAWPFASSAPPINISPTLSKVAPLLLLIFVAPMSSRFLAAMTAAVVTPLAASASLLRLMAAMLRSSP